MPALLFNSNHQSVILPSEALAVDHIQAGSTFNLRCLYACWSVTDLYHEWGVHDFPGESAKWVASFIASPQPSEVAPIENPEVRWRIQIGELYWIVIHPTKSPMERIPLLCMADSDDFYFGVATDEAEAAAMFGDHKSYDAEAWLTVSIEAFELSSSGGNHDRNPVLKLVISGEPIGDWIRANIEPVAS